MKKFEKNIANQRDRLQSEVAMLNQRVSSLRFGVQQLSGISHGGKRNLYDVYGYPVELDGVDGYRLMYNLTRRMGFANRLTAGMAKSCWREGFKLKADGEGDAEKIEEDFIKALNKRGMNAALERADILNRIGRFSVLFVGIPDGNQPDQAVGRVSPDKVDQVYFRMFAYDGITITQYDKDPKSPRYGLPVMYQVENISSSTDREKDNQVISMPVHWTRIVHLNENGLVSDIEGMGYLEPIFNRLLDFQKTVGGSSEAYFRNARRIITAEIDPQYASGMTPEAKQAYNDASEKFVNGWQDNITVSGAKVNQLQATHSSPLDTAKSILWEVAGYTGWPLRVLTGEGAGQLAGSEDQLAYNALVSDRQTLFCAGTVNKLMDIFAMAGMITLPDNYIIDFPLQAAVSEKQEAENNNTRANTLKTTEEAVGAAGGSIDRKSAFAAVGLHDVDVDKPVNMDDE